MSFDLAVWFEQTRISAAEAAAKYGHLCEKDIAGAGVVASPAVLAFSQELTAEFPGLPQPETESCPWTAGLDLSDTHVIMPMTWGSAGKVAPRVLDLASRHGLVCFDPQTEVLHVPPKLRGTDGLRLQPCVGLPVEDPDPDVVERAVHQVSGQNWFLILEKRLGRYVQVGTGANSGVTAGFAVEHRDGSPDQHYRCVVSEMDQVAAIFADFVAGEGAWSVDVQWEKLSM